MRNLQDKRPLYTPTQCKKTFRERLPHSGESAGGGPNLDTATGAR